MKYHFIAIGGTGMGALAGLLKASGHDVRGSDHAVYPPMSDQLAALEIPVFDGYSADNLDWQPDVVVVGNTVGKEHVEVLEAKRRNLEMTSLPATLGAQYLADRHSIVVAGTHGKTTTASILSHLLIHAGRDPGCFIGGVPQNYQRGWRKGEGREFVVEGDEYDSAFFDKGSKFLHYRPRTAILTSVELDHVDIFSSMDEVRRTFRKFVKLIPEDGLLVVASDSREAMQVADAAKCRVETYRVTGHDVAGRAATSDEGPTANWEVRDPKYLKSGRCRFGLYHDDELFGGFETMLSGAHNLANIAATIAVAHNLDLSAEDIRQGVQTFAGVRRRQEVRGIAQGVRVIDDYAHHPTAVAATLKGLRRRYKGSKLIAVYEPRSATSRRKTFQREFASAFAHADVVVVGRLHDPSRIPEEQRFDPGRLALDLHQAGTTAVYVEKIPDVVAYLVENAHASDVVVVFSSGAFGGLHDLLLTALGDAVIPARRIDMSVIRELLEELNLDWRDITDDDSGNFLCLVNERGVTGCIGLELFGEEAVLRSLAVRPGSRGVGYGWMLADTVIARARRLGVRRLYLMTEHASDFFAAKHGFRAVDLSTLSPDVASSVTFRTPKGKSSVAMRLDL